MIVEQSSRFAANKIGNDDCALGGVGDERFSIGGVAAQITPIFSPRDTLAALDRYAEQAKNANDALFMTFAFGMNQRFQDLP